MRPIKVSYIIATLDVGGAEKQLVELLKRLDRSRFLPTVCCLSKAGPLRDELVQNGVKVEIISFRGLSFLRQPVKVAHRFAQLVQFIKQERPEIVHGLLFWAYIPATYAAKLAGVPIAISGRRGLGRFKASKLHYLFLEG
ncbi:MAG: glycosyltransferase, partial [Candidatus Methylomirabilales bacterium]